MIAEYDGNNNLLRKYIYGPSVDQPVSMIEVADNNAAYYYHYDGHGSVIALSNSSGDTVQTYEYSVYGEVAVEDANHTNPYMYAGRRYDAELGLYYNRARYYNPYIGRFIQPDPSCYQGGMNMYHYCSNNPLNRIDPFGLIDSNDGNDGNSSVNVFNSDSNDYENIVGQVDWLRMMQCGDNISQQESDCKLAWRSKMTRLRFYTTTTGGVGGVGLGVFCTIATAFAWGAGPLVGGGVAVLCGGVTAGVLMTMNAALSAIDESMAAGIDYCEDKADWCRGNRQDEPVWGAGGDPWPSRPRSVSDSQGNVLWEKIIWLE